jgi:hypothetical protein
VKDIIKLRVKASYNRESIVKALTEEGYIVQSVFEKENEYSIFNKGYWVITIYDDEIDGQISERLENVRFGPSIEKLEEITKIQEQLIKSLVKEAQKSK